jgi:hypothetical protein
MNPSIASLPLGSVLLEPPHESTNSERRDNLVGRFDNDRVSRYSVKLFKARRALRSLSATPVEAAGLGALSSRTEGRES